MSPYAHVQGASFPQPMIAICAPCCTELARHILFIRAITVQDNAIVFDHACCAPPDGRDLIADVTHQCTESYETADAEQRPVLAFLKEADYAQMIASIEGL